MALAASGMTFKSGASPTRPPLARVIIDNDFAGDPDGLFQLAHHVLCPSIWIPFIIGSHLPGEFGSGHDASDAAAKASELLRIMKLDGGHRILAGAERPIGTRDAWRASAASAAIIREAMREDTKVPLVYASGAGLTDLALAWLQEPRIGSRMKLIWIGGNEHPGIANPPPGPKEIEFNFAIDPLAVQVIFNESDIEIWQVPRDAYRQMLFSNADLDEFASSSVLGQYLKSQVDEAMEKLARTPGVPPISQTEAYVLGDSPLVTLTVLTPPFNPDPASCPYLSKPTPHVRNDGSYEDRPGSRPMRIYTSIDKELTFRDMLAKFRRVSAARSAG